MPTDIAIIRIRRDTFANWTSVNPTLALGEISYDLTNHQIRVGDGTNAWLSLPVIGSSIIADGDKGDIVISGGGTTWSLDSALMTLINNKLDSGPLDGGSASSLDQQIQIRRDITVNWNNKVLNAGEIGYDSSLNEIRIGNGTAIWQDLDPIGMPKLPSLSITQLFDVEFVAAPPVEGEVLTFDETAGVWTNKVIPTPSLTLNDLTTVTLTAPQNTEILQFNGTQWVNAPGPSPSATIPLGSKNEITVVGQNDWQINDGVITQDNLNLALPVNPQDAATKDYTDAIVGLAIAANVIEELDQANGIAVLNSSRVVAKERLATGTPTTTKFVRGDGTWAEVGMNDITAVDTTGLIAGDVLRFNAFGSWVPTSQIELLSGFSPALGSILPPNPRVDGSLFIWSAFEEQSSTASLADSGLCTISWDSENRVYTFDVPSSHPHALADLEQSGATPGQVIKWNGSAWAAADDATGGAVSLALNDLTDVTLSDRAQDNVLVLDNTLTWVNRDRTTWLTGHTQPLTTITIPTPQQVSGRLLWWNNDSLQLRTVTLGGTGLASISHDNTANTITVNVPASHTHTLSNISDAGTMAAQNANAVAITGGTLQGTTVTTGAFSSPSNEAIMHTVRKATAGTITKGQVIRVVGSTGSHLTVELADASVEATSKTTMGIAAETITDSTSGYMMIAGELTGLSNLPASGGSENFVNGNLLWLSETTGAFTQTRPTQPAHGVTVGWVVSSSNGSNGRIYVKIDNGQELDEIHDVLLGTKAEKDILSWDNTAGLWRNRTRINAGVAPSDASFVVLESNAGVPNATSLGSLGNGLLKNSSSLGIGSLSIANASDLPLHTHTIANVTGLQTALDNKVDDSQISAFGLTLIDDTTATVARATLELGSLATLSTVTDSQITNNTISGLKLTDTTVTVAKINATGSASSTTFLRGDGQWQTPTSSGAPADATYIVQTVSTGLSSEFALSSLGNGLLKNANGTGILTIATGSDLPSHTHAQSDITNLVTDLAGKASTSHTHSAADITTGSLALARLAQGGATAGSVLKWNNISLTWEPGTDNTGGSAAPGGSDRQVQFNDSNLVIAGASQVEIEAGGNLKLIKPGSSPATPAANSLVMYPITYAGREFPAYKDENGFATNLQVCLAKNKVRIYNASNTNTAAGIFGFPAFTTFGTLTARNFATTNKLATVTRHAYVSTASAAQSWAQMRSPNSGLFCWRGNAADLGGFYVLFRFAISDATLNTAGEVFVGLSNDATTRSLTSAFSAETMLDTVGLYAIDGATSYSIGCNDNTGTATLTALGASFPVDNTSFYELILFAKPNDTNIFYEVTNISTGANTSGTLTTDLPRNTVGLGVQIIRGNNTSTSSAPAFDISQIYAETPF